MIGHLGNGNKIMYEVLKEWRLKYAQTQKGMKTTPSKLKPKLNLDAGRMF